MVQKMIADALLDRAIGGEVIIHTKAVERNIILDGLGCLSVSRYLRAMRQYGLVDYDNPRRHNHFYVIKILPKLKKWMKGAK